MTGPETQEPPPRSAGDVFNERAWAFPVCKSYAGLTWNSSEVNHQTHNDNAHDQEDLQNGEEELHLSVHADEENAHAERDQDEQRDP